MGWGFGQRSRCSVEITLEALETSSGIGGGEPSTCCLPVEVFPRSGFQNGDEGVPHFHVPWEGNYKTRDVREQQDEFAVPQELVGMPCSRRLAFMDSGHSYRDERVARKSSRARGSNRRRRRWRYDSWARRTLPHQTQRQVQAPMLCPRWPNEAKRLPGHAVAHGCIGDHEILFLIGSCMQEASEARRCSYGLPAKWATQANVFLQTFLCRLSWCRFRWSFNAETRSSPEVEVPWNCRVQKAQQTEPSRRHSCMEAMQGSVRTQGRRCSIWAAQRMGLYDSRRQEVMDRSSCVLFHRTWPQRWNKPMDPLLESYRRFWILR